MPNPWEEEDQIVTEQTPEQTPFYENDPVVAVAPRPVDLGDIGDVVAEHVLDLGEGMDSFESAYSAYASSKNTTADAIRKALKDKSYVGNDGEDAIKQREQNLWKQLDDSKSQFDATAKQAFKSQFEKLQDARELVPLARNLAAYPNQFRKQANAVPEDKQDLLAALTARELNKMQAQRQETADQETLNAGMGTNVRNQFLQGAENLGGSIAGVGRLLTGDKDTPAVRMASSQRKSEDEQSLNKLPWYERWSSKTAGFAPDLIANLPMGGLGKPFWAARFTPDQVESLRSQGVGDAVAIPTAVATSAILARLMELKIDKILPKSIMKPLEEYTMKTGAQLATDMLKKGGIDTAHMAGISAANEIIPILSTQVATWIDNATGGKAQEYELGKNLVEAAGRIPESFALNVFQMLPGKAVESFQSVKRQGEINKWLQRADAATLIDLTKYDQPSRQQVVDSGLKSHLGLDERVALSERLRGIVEKADPKLLEATKVGDTDAAIKLKQFITREWNVAENNELKTPKAEVPTDAESQPLSEFTIQRVSEKDLIGKESKPVDATVMSLGEMAKPADLERQVNILRDMPEPPTKAQVQEMFGSMKREDAGALLRLAYGDRLPERKIKEMENAVPEQVAAKPESESVIGPDGLARTPDGHAKYIEELNANGERVYQETKPEEVPPPPVENPDVIKPERRQDGQRRKLVAEMTPEERAQALLTSEKTGLSNSRAYEESDKTNRPQTFADVDGFKAYNDSLGYDAGDQIIKAVGKLIQKSGASDAFHMSGDEFVFNHKDAHTAIEAMKKVDERLQNAVIYIESIKTGKKYEVRGLRMTHGTGATIGEAEAKAKENKNARYQAGERQLRSEWEQQLKENPDALPRGVTEVNTGRSEEPSGNRDLGRSGQGVAGIQRTIQEVTPEKKSFKKQPIAYQEGQDVRYFPDSRFKKAVDAKILRTHEDGSITLEYGKKVSKLDSLGLKKTETVLQQVRLPSEQVRRLVQPTAEQKRAATRAEEQKALSKMSPEEATAIRNRAADANKAADLMHAQELEAYGSDPTSRRVAESIQKAGREKYVASVGDGVKTEQRAAGLPKTLEKVLNANPDAKEAIPETLKTVEIRKHAVEEPESPKALSEGDQFKLAGEKYTVGKLTEDGKVKVKDGLNLKFPADAIPVDKGTKVVKAKAEKPLIEMDKNMFGETVVSDEAKAKLEQKGEQTKLFENELTTDEKRARKLAQQHRDSGGGELFSEGNREIPVSMEPAGKEVSAHEVIARMQKDFGLPIRTGHVAQKKAAGIYKILPEVVRLKRGYEADLAVASHEVAHHVYETKKLYDSMPYDVKSEVSKLDYDPEKARTHEGFAEFVRHYMTRDDAQQIAPKTFEWFTQQFSKDHADSFGLIEKHRAYVEQWRKQGAIARGMGQVSFTGKPARPAGETLNERIREGMQDAWGKVKTAMIDEGEPIKQMQNEAKRRGFNAGPDAPYELYSAMSQTGPSMANEAMEKGVFTLNKEGFREKIGPSMKDVLKEINPKEYQDFVLWAVSRHALESNRKGKETGISTEDAQHIYDKGKNPRWEKAAKNLTDLNNSLIDMLERSGVITGESASKIKSAYETYLPLMRVANENKVSLSGGGKMVNLGGAVKGRKGSELQILDPIQATYERSIKFYNLASKTEVMRSMWDMTRKTNGMGEYMEQVPPNKAPTTFSAEQITKQLQDMGVDVSGVDPHELLTVFKPDYWYKGNEPIARIIVDGKPVLVQMHPELYKALNGMNAVQLPGFMNVFREVAGLARLGYTGLSPSFTIKNAARDMQTYFMQRKEASGIKGAAAPAKWLASYAVSEGKRLIGQESDPVVDLWKSVGGDLTTTLGQDRKKIQAKIQEVLSDDKQVKALNIVKHPVESLRTVIGISEGAPRLSEFEASLKKSGVEIEQLRNDIRNGKALPREAVIKAINAANDVTVNFKRHGWIGKYINQVVPFFNAPIQATEKAIRTWVDDPKTAAVRTATLVAASVGYWLYKKDEDWYKEAPAWLKYGFWTITDDSGKPIVRIPRSQEYGVTISGGVEAILDAWYQKNPKEVGEWAGEMVKTIAPPNPVTNMAIVGPSVNLYANWDSFRQAPIVPDSVKDRKPGDQSTPYNTDLMKLIGQRLGISPAKLEYLVDQNTGGMYSGVVKPIETGGMQTEELPGLRGIMMRRDFSKTQTEFYDKKNQVTEEYNSAHDKGTVTPELKREYKKFNEYGELISHLQKESRLRLTRDTRFEVDRYTIGTVREAMGKDDLGRYPSITKDDGSMPQEVRNIRDEFLSRKVMMATDPRPQRQHREPLDKFLERKEKWEQETEQAREAIAAYEGVDMAALLKAAVKKRGFNTATVTSAGSLTQFGLRKATLRKITGKADLISRKQ